MQSKLFMFVATLAFFIGFQQNATAQRSNTYHGIILDDVPAIMTVTPNTTTGKFTLNFQVVGSEEEWTMDAEYSFNYDNSKMRFYGDDGEGNEGFFLYDISSELGLPDRSVFSGYSYSNVGDIGTQKMVFFVE